jgi:allantoin racemase
MQRIYDRVLQPDKRVEPRFVDRSTYYTSHRYLELLNNAEVVRGIIEGEEDGCDVAMVRCGNDAGVQAAREMVRIPVVAMSEASMHLASQLGSRFALIGVDDKSIPLVEYNLRAYGPEGRAIARRPVRVPRSEGWDELVGNGPTWFASPEYVLEHVVPAFEQTALECIEEGAEVIVTACALLGALTLAGYEKIGGTEVPVLDSVAVGIKTAEMLGGLHRSLGLSTSKHLTYQSLVPPALRAQLTAPLEMEGRRAPAANGGASGQLEGWGR